LVVVRAGRVIGAADAPERVTLTTSAAVSVFTVRNRPPLVPVRLPSTFTLALFARPVIEMAPVEAATS